MAKAITPSFITEVRLVVSSQVEREFDRKFNAGRQLYNACLNEAMVRVNLVRNSPSYQRAKTLPLTVKKAKKIVNNPERKKLFNEAWKQYRFSEYELHSFATIVANQSKWIAAKVDSNTSAKIG